MEVGISVPDMDMLTIGLILDVWNEKGNDGVTYAYSANQGDFDSF